MAPAAANPSVVEGTAKAAGRSRKKRGKKDRATSAREAAAPELVDKEQKGPSVQAQGEMGQVCPASSRTDSIGVSDAVLSRLFAVGLADNLLSSCLIISMAEEDPCRQPHRRPAALMRACLQQSWRAAAAAGPTGAASRVTNTVSA